MSTASQLMPENLANRFRQEFLQRLLGWTRVRWLIAALLFVVTLYYRPTLGLPYPIIPILILVLLSISFNCLMFFLLQRHELLPHLKHAQVAMDLFIVSAVVQSTGGVASPFQWFYLFIIVATGLLAGQRYSIGVALISTLLYALILLGQYHFVFPHIPVGDLATYSLHSFLDGSLLINSVALNAIMFIGIGGLSGYVAETAERRKEELLESYRFYHWAMFRSVTMAEEKERKRISRDLHDEIGQILIATLFNLEKLEDVYVDRLSARKRLQNLHLLVRDSLDALHRAIADLRPPMLDDLGLISSITWYTDKYIAPLSIVISIRIDGQEIRLEEAVEITLYRVIQEALTNVVKHAQAHEINIILRFETKEVTLIVSDDGVGFTARISTQGSSSGWGIVGMKERLAMVDGRLDISSEPGKGTTLTITVPNVPRAGSVS